MEKEIKKPFYQRWWMWLFIGLSMMYVFSNFMSSGTSTNTATQPREAIKVSALTLVSEYRDNGVAADTKYKDQLVEVTGVVESIDKDILGTPYVALESYKYAIIDHIQCMFSHSNEAELGTVKKGQKITLRGEVQGKSGNIVVTGCSIVK